MWIEIVGWIMTIISIIGTIMNVKKLKSCFILWGFTNIWWCWYDIYKIAYPQAALQFIYFLLSIYGIYEWSKKRG